MLQVLFTIPIYVSYTAIEKAGGAGVPVVWWHLMPFAPTAQHAPPVGFGDGHTYFSFTAKLKWKLAYSYAYDLVYKAAVRHAADPLLWGGLYPWVQGGTILGLCVCRYVSELLPKDSKEQLQRMSTGRVSSCVLAKLSEKRKP